MSASSIEQGTDEWKALRCGKATASRIADIMRKTKSGVSASRARYMGELVAERLTGRPNESFKSADMEWGNVTEEEARNAYAFDRDAVLEAVAFVDHPHIPMCGASPDRLVVPDGLVEIKCPASHTHIATLLGAPIDPDYIVQMQWQMSCTDRKWCDWVSYDPRLPGEMALFVKRIHRDEAVIRELECEVSKFLDEVSTTVSKLTEKYALKEAA